jgi:hypothetical protein
MPLKAFPEARVVVEVKEFTPEAPMQRNYTMPPPRNASFADGGAVQPAPQQARFDVAFTILKHEGWCVT